MAEPASAEGFALAGEVAEIPEAVLGVIRNGFAIAATLPEEKRQNAIQLLVRQIERAGGRLDSDVVARATGLSKRDASRLSAALSLAVGLLTDTSASASEFVTVGRGKFFEDKHAIIVDAIARQIVSQRTELQESMARENLAAIVLPSLTRFDVAIDLRFKFADGQIKDRVAVAVAHIGTDDRSQRLWLQLSRHDIERIIERLTETLRQMEMAEATVPQRSKEAGE